MIIEIISHPINIIKARLRAYRLLRKNNQKYKSRNSVIVFYDSPLVISFRKNKITVISDSDSSLEIKKIADFLAELLDNDHIGMKLSEKRYESFFAQLNSVKI